MAALLAAPTLLWLVAMVAVAPVAMLAAPKVTTKVLPMILKTLFRLFSHQLFWTQTYDFARIMYFQNKIETVCLSGSWCRSPWPAPWRCGRRRRGGAAMRG